MVINKREISNIVSFKNRKSQYFVYRYVKSKNLFDIQIVCVNRSDSMVNNITFFVSFVILIACDRIMKQ